MKSRWSIFVGSACACLLGRLVNAQTCSTTEEAGFIYEITPETDLTVFWSIDENAELVSFKVTYTGTGWVSLGFSDTGDMIGSDAVIGLPNDQSVLEYDLTSKDQTTLPEESETQEISSTSVTQEADQTTITFTRPLDPMGEGKQQLSATAGDTTILIWAAGSENDLGYHESSRGVTSLDLFCMESEEDDDDVNEEALVTGEQCNSSDPNFDFETSPEDDLTLFWSIHEDTSEISMKAVHAGEGWVGVGFSGGEGAMIPGDAVVALPDELSVLEYDLTAYIMPDLSDIQELTNTTVSQTGGFTTLTFVRPLVPSSSGKQILVVSETVFLIYGVGSSNTLAFHAVFGKFSVTLGECDISGANIDQLKENVHGWFMALGWGVLMPTGVIVARFSRPKHDWWLQAHWNIQVMAMAMGLVGFAMALLFTGDRGVDHFLKGHARNGLILTVLLVFQISLAFFHPHAVPKGGDSPYDEVSTFAFRIRCAWQIVHRLNGLLILTWGIIQIYSGLEELSVAEFWTWTYSLVLIIIVLVFFILQVRAILSKQYGEVRPSLRRKVSAVVGPVRGGVQ